MTGPSSESRRFVVLVALDDSEHVHEILRAGAKIARGMPGGELHLVHAVENLPPAVSLVPPPTGMGVSRREILAAARAYVAALASEVRGYFGGHVTTQIALGKARAQILLAAAQVQADLVLVGTHGRRGVPRMLLGSVAEGVVRGATCPVLVVRPKDYSAVEQIETQQATTGDQP